MKVRNIFISGLCVLALTACNDFLDVDAPSKHNPEKIFGSTKDVGTALNGVTASILEGKAFGNTFTYSLIFNTDVDFCANSSATKQTNTPKRYDMTDASSDAKSAWDALYSGVENANNFIHYLESSPIYNKDNEDFATLQQYMGEAKFMRAMLFNEAICYWGDVPFTMQPTSVTENFTPAIVSRDVIAKTIIEDLIAAAPTMKMTADIADGIERPSREACWALISRIALQAAGYSLRHADDDTDTYGYMGKPSEELEKWFLTQAHDYAKMVMDANTHSLKQSYQEVFVDECNLKVNNTDDVIFELPFAVEASGNIGYNQGPKFEETGGATEYQWGKCSGGQQVSKFYYYSFKKGDQRRDVQNGWWYYTYDGIPKIQNSYSFFNNKWSKLWNSTSAYNKTSSSNTGINYPYLRYADVLLMFAEADLKLNGTVSDDAKDAVQQVRNRAYMGSGVTAPNTYASDYDGFLKDILNERKWEFAGENSRWKDLVRNNMLAEVLYHTFFTFWTTSNSMGGVSDATNESNVMAYDGIDYYGSETEVYTADEIMNAIPGDNAFGQTVGDLKKSLLPTTLYYCYVQNPKDQEFFANKELPCIYVYNKASDKKPANDYKTADKFFKYLKNNYSFAKQSQWTPIPEPGTVGADIKKDEMKNTDKGFFDWYDTDNDYPRAQVLYSFYGFIHGGETGDAKRKVYIVRDGVEEEIQAAPFNPNPSDLPVVRYLLPIPKETITRAAGVYKNYYGYGK
ncbi:MAG: RagB/SusD family nutrient uptake outer membrane protein [Prevotella sp.]|nr:RagB/SusD family nutrient uptake outer membrane protein [Candidatus Prevotella equi]